MIRLSISRLLKQLFRARLKNAEVRHDEPSDKQFAEDIKYINEITQEVLGLSDRGRAVLIGAELDRYLKQLLSAYLLEKCGKTDTLFDTSGALSTFGSRIEMLYRLGLLHPDWYHDLKIINRIRNKFAHGPVGMTLSEQSVSALCSNLIAGKNWIEQGKSNSVDNPQTRFVASYVVLFGHLCSVRKTLKRIPEIWRKYRNTYI